MARAVSAFPHCQWVPRTIYGTSRLLWELFVGCGLWVVGCPLFLPRHTFCEMQGVK
jgi:hypothetical protein